MGDDDTENVDEPVCGITNVDRSYSLLESCIKAGMDFSARQSKAKHVQHDAALHSHS